MSFWASEQFANGGMVCLSAASQVCTKTHAVISMVCCGQNLDQLVQGEPTGVAFSIRLQKADSLLFSLLPSPVHEASRIGDAVLAAQIAASISGDGTIVRTV
jgi:hypothetical protein